MAHPTAEAGELVVPVVDEGLGNSAYLVDLGDGRALAVDASRDLRSLLAQAERRGLRVAYAAETHLHADFVSGARQLAAVQDATVLASAAGARAFPHTGLEDGEEVDLGGLRLRAVATPGHTDEHLTFLLLDGSAPLGVFTGGSLIVGAAARTDLVARERTEELARSQYRSLQRLVALPDHVEVWPTHGAGSFCSAPPGPARTTTIGREKASNSLLSAPDEDAFADALLGSLGSFPAYFGRLGEVNRRGPRVLPAPGALEQLPAEHVQALLARDATLVDVRPIREYARAHVPGSLSIELRDAFATWLGWLVPEGGTLVVLRDADQDPSELVAQATKIGYDDVAGELAGGLSAWRAAGFPTATTRLTTAEEVAGEQILDVRQASEYAAGHVPGAVHIELGELADAPVRLAKRPVTVMCGHGERAMTGASVLERAGWRDLAVLLGGPREWSGSHGVPLETTE